MTAGAVDVFAVSVIVVYLKITVFLKRFFHKKKRYPTAKSRKKSTEALDNRAQRERVQNPALYAVEKRRSFEAAVKQKTK